MRVTGIRPPRPKLFLGFSPKAIFMARGERRTISSMVLPQVFMATKVPAMGLELPGPVATVVTPPRTATPYSGSRG